MSKLLSTREAAVVLGVQDSRIRQLIAAGRLPAVKIGGIWLLKANSLADFTRAKRGPKPRAP